jgi:UDP-N-acetylmuramate dehydrogenase
MGLIDGLEHIILENEPLAHFTRLRLGGVAEYFAQPTSLEELSEIIRRCSHEAIPMRLIGGGSNVLVSDEGVAGMVIHLSAPRFSQIQLVDGGLVVGGGAHLSHFVSTAVREGYAGPEQLVGIPGTVGGALHENTGTANADIGTWVEGVTVITGGGEILERSRDELHFAYRQSNLSELAILDARFKFETDDPGSLTKRLQKLWIARRAQQPLSQENAAYVFKDHGGEAASKLIDLAGLKSTRVGQVEISSRDSNFLVANSGASSDDVKRLVD